MNLYYFAYDAANGIIAARFEGQVGDRLFREFYEAAPGYIEGRRVRAGILDFTHITEFDVSTAAIRDVAARSPLVADPAPRYVVAPLDHAYGMIRMFQAVSIQGREMLHVVRSAGEAYAALGVSNPRFERLS